MVIDKSGYQGTARCINHNFAWYGSQPAHVPTYKLQRFESALELAINVVLIVGLICLAKIVAGKFYGLPENQQKKWLAAYQSIYQSIIKVNNHQFFETGQLEARG